MDNKNVLSGKTSLKLASSGFNWIANSSLSKKIDLKNFENQDFKMVINVYTDYPEKISGIRVDLGDNNDVFYYASQQSQNFYVKGWNRVIFSKIDFKAQGGPSGWQAIKWLRVNLAAKDDTSHVDAWIDDWSVTDNVPDQEISGPSKNIAGVSDTIFSNVNKINSKINQGFLDGRKMNTTFIIVLVSVALLGIIFVIILSIRRRNRNSNSYNSYPTDRSSNESLGTIKKITKINLNPRTAAIAITISVIVFAFLFFERLDKSGANTFPQVAGTANVQEGNINNNSWQYKVIIFTIPQDKSKDIEAELDKLGQEGWELVSQNVISSGKSGQYYQYNTLKMRK